MNNITQTSASLDTLHNEESIIRDMSSDDVLHVEGGYAGDAIGLLILIIREAGKPLV